MDRGPRRVVSRVVRGFEGYLGMLVLVWEEVRGGLRRGVGKEGKGLWIGLE